MYPDFILNDSNKANSHGFYVSNDKVNLERVKSNPVMLFNHDDDCIIGRWKDVRIENNLMIGTPEFDLEDEEAKRIAGKVERKFLLGASLGFMPITWEEKKGKTTLLEWEWVEASIVSIPSNANAVSLYNSERKRLTVEEMTLTIEKVKKTSLNNKTMDKIILSVGAYNALGLDENATTEQINEAVIKLKATNTDALTKLSTATTELQTLKDTEATTLVDGAIAEGKITAEKKESFLSLAKTNLSHAKELIGGLPGKKSLSQRVGANEKNADSGAQGREDWTYTKWAKEDPKGLAELKANNVEAFEALRSK